MGIWKGSLYCQSYVTENHLYWVFDLKEALIALKENGKSQETNKQGWIL